MKWDEARNDRLRGQWGKISVAKIAAAESTSIGAVYRQARRLGLKTKPRLVSSDLSPNHRAIKGRTSKYPKSVISARKSKRVLISGSQNRKLGHIVSRGKWAGLYIYSLSLTERKSCPESCLEWLSCYGNSMHNARRHLLDRDLLSRLFVELDMLAARNPRDFLVRLHTLGDFGKDESEALPYVKFWRERMREIPQIHIFGFTAHAPGSIAGQAVMNLNLEFPDRCRIRFSGITSSLGFGSIVIDSEGDSLHVVCPIETEHPKKPKDCGACGLCWTMQKTVEFVRH